MDAEIDRLIALHADKAYAVALRMTGNSTDAGDVVQEAFLRVMRYFDKYDPTLPFEAWMVQILKNVYFTSLRKEAVPLLRYRTRDLTRLLSGPCSCGSTFPPTRPQPDPPGLSPSPKSRAPERPERQKGPLLRHQSR